MASHINFMARVHEPAAVRLFEAYRDSLGSLSENPNGYPKYEPQSPIDKELHYKLFSKRYRIVFEIVGNLVFIYDIQDCRQDVDKNLI
jgi:hypothetical protein